MNGRFVLKASGNQFLFNLKAGNNEVILTSERYTVKSSALKGIAAVRESAAEPSRYDRCVSSRGEAYFVLRADNHEVIGTSELYSSASARDGGIAAVAVAAASADLDDQTRTSKGVSA